MVLIYKGKRSTESIVVIALYDMVEKTSVSWFLTLRTISMVTI